MDVMELDLEPSGYGNPGLLDQASSRAYSHGTSLFFVTSSISSHFNLAADTEGTRDTTRPIPDNHIEMPSLALTTLVCI